MAEVKRINKIPITFTKGKEEYELYTSVKSMKIAKEVKAQIKDHQKKVCIETFMFQKEKLYCVLFVRKDS